MTDGMATVDALYLGLTLVPEWLAVIHHEAVIGVYLTDMTWSLSDIRPLSTGYPCCAMTEQATVSCR